MKGETTTRQQDAVRLLVLLYVCGSEPVADLPREDAVTEIRGEARVQALDFWLRNPDYLAFELLELNNEQPSSDLVTAAQALLEQRDRHFPTIRFFFGAYSELDGALNLLRCYELAWEVRRAPSQKRRRDFYLLKAGSELVESRLKTSEDLNWYFDRAELVRLVAGERGGDELKQFQKRLDEYGDIKWGRYIEPVHERVIERLRDLEGVVA